MDYLSLLFLAIGLNLIGFGFAYDAKTDKLTDLSYGATFLILGLKSFLDGSKSLPQILLFAIITLWAVRLATFLYMRILDNQRDKRFDGVREDFWKFGKFWVGQAVSVWLILLPAIFVLRGQQAKFTGLTLIGWAIIIFGIFIETLADAQKLDFKSYPKNKNRWIEQGIWKYSRHPNYFGEMLMWAGVYIYAFSSLDGWQRLVSLASPFWISFLLIFVTGIPQVEKSADKKWGKQAAYKTYKQRTSLLVPLPKSPKGVK